jgi:hypothetical protein
MNSKFGFYEVIDNPGHLSLAGGWIRTHLTHENLIHLSILTLPVHILIETTGDLAKMIRS